MRRAFIFSLVFAMVSITACGENDHPVLSEQHEQANGEENNKIKKLIWKIVLSN